MGRLSLFAFDSKSLGEVHGTFLGLSARWVQAPHHRRPAHLR